MKKITKLILALLLFQTACQKDTNKRTLPTPPPIEVQKSASCGQVSLDFTFKQKLSPSQEDSLHIVVTNRSSTPTSISPTNPLKYYVHLVNTNLLHNQYTLHQDTLQYLLIDQSRETLINTNYNHEITSNNIEVRVDILEGDTCTNPFAGVYDGECLIPRKSGAITDTTSTRARCVISADRQVKIWLDGMEEDTRFVTRSITGRLLGNGLFTTGRAIDLKKDLVSYMSPVDNSGTTHHSSLPTSTGKLELNIFFTTPQAIYTTHSCTNLILQLQKIH